MAAQFCSEVTHSQQMERSLARHSAATRCPERALALGKKCLSYLSGTRDHGVALTVEHTLRPVRGWRAKLEAYGDASYEEGWAQTGVLVTYKGMTISWTSTKQVQVPRGTAESEVAAMADVPHTVDCTAWLYHTMRIAIGKPTLHCDIRAAMATCRVSVAERDAEGLPSRLSFARD